MSTQLRSTLLDCLRLMLRPIIRFCFHRSLGLQDLLESAKIVFLEVAEEEMKKKGQKVNISRLSVATGVHRKDAVRIHREGNTKDTSMRFTTRVIGQWRHDPRYLTQSGRPRVLSYEGDESEFAELVQLVSTDLHPGTLLFDLERTGAVERTKAGLKLVARAHVPKNNPKEGFRMMAGDTEDLMMGVMDNIFCEEEPPPNYHGKVMFDNVDEKDLPKIRDWLFKESSKFHERVEKHLSKYDLDINPKKGRKGGKRIALGIFSRS